VSGYVLNYLLTPEIKRAHKARWFAYAGGERIPAQSTMRGTWGWDVVCSCGWETNTGGGVRSYVEDKLWDHRYSAQCEKERESE
jgi:hypothetical protein